MKHELYIKMKTSQKEQVKKILLNTGEVSRNACLSIFITRLSAIIQDLEEEGWIFNPKWVKTKHGKDFMYYLTTTPLKKTQYYIKEIDRVITTYA